MLCFQDGTCVSVNQVSALCCGCFGCVLPSTQYGFYLQHSFQRPAPLLCSFYKTFTLILFNKFPSFPLGYVQKFNNHLATLLTTLVTTLKKHSEHHSSHLAKINPSILPILPSLLEVVSKNVLHSKLVEFFVVLFIFFPPSKACAAKKPLES